MTATTAISAETIKATILAGTIGHDTAAGPALPPAHDPACPEPGWIDRKSVV